MAVQTPPHAAPGSNEQLPLSAPAISIVCHPTPLSEQDMTRVQEFERLADTSRFLFLAVATRILRNHADAEDAVQRALFRGWLALDSYASAGTLTAWLYTIVSNECRLILRHRRQTTGSSAAVTKEYSWKARDPDPEQICMRHELQQVLHHEISRLPRDFRNALRADLAGEEYNRTVAAKSLRQRARKGLRERIARRYCELCTYGVA